ncbi:unnamed protein product [Adineta ricciae]|uniref:Uncharacterized protein n=1 Tax=Adineta ricciae TaxID=249248 RepID=A0A814AGX0_ADIRI|nr:unnamed protein product [Adineta ricciae]
MKLFSVIKRARTKSENDLSKRGSIDQNEKKNLPTTNSSFTVSQPSNENPSTTSYHHQSNEKVNHTNTVVYRRTSRRYSNSFFTSARYGGPRTSIAVIPSTTLQNLQLKQPLTDHTSSSLSRSVDRIHNNKASRRELRYEEHDDYIPPLHSIQCHPSIDHYVKNLNQSTQFSSNQRPSPIETDQLSSTANRTVSSRPYSSNIPLSYSLQMMPKSSSDNTNKKGHNDTYGKLSDCHSPLSPLENSVVKAPRRIESAYSQFPIPEPVYANTQSLYDNILYPQSATRVLSTVGEQDKRSCASQTQLTWTMATFSSFVDLENQSVIIPQPDPNTLYSIVQHFQPQPPPSASSDTIEHLRRRSPDLRYADDTNPSIHYQRPRSPASMNLVMIEKRDGSNQTHLTIAPTQDIEANSHLFIHDPSPSPNSSSSMATGQQKQHHHHHHHHHRKHKSRSNGHISTRDVGLQVNIQTVKKITIVPQKSDDSSLTTTTASSPSLLKTPRELRDVETNTEPTSTTKRDTSTSYESNVRLVTSSSQTVDSPTLSSTSLHTKAAQTPNKTLRDQSIETNNRGLFVCDLSSLLKNSPDDESPSTSTSLNTKRKS